MVIQNTNLQNCLIKTCKMFETHNENPNLYLQKKNILIYHLNHLCYSFFNQFPAANITAILRKLTDVARGKDEEVRSFFARNDPSGGGVVQYDQFRSLLQQLCNGALLEHEIMTIGRYYCNRQDESPIDANTLVAVVQEQLRKHNYENFSKLAEGCMHHDKEK